jgi:protein-disulfide isomerase
MIVIDMKRGLRNLGLLMALALGIAAVQVGCKPKDKGTTAVASAAASASGSNKPDPALTGPCGGFIKKVCEKSGESSQACREVKSVADLLPPAACKAASSQASYAVGKIEEKRKDCEKLVSKLCGELGSETETCKMVQTQTKNFPPERCTTMLGRYADVLAELKKMESANKPLEPAKQQSIAAADAPSFGPADSKVTLVEFSDFQCPFCSRAATAVKELKTKYGTKVHFVFRQFPLSFHQNAHLAAEASLAANAQGKFWEFHDKVFENQKALERDALEKYAKEVGLKIDQFKKALDGKEFAAKVDADMKLGNDVAVSGTPTLFVNGKRVQNPTDVASVSKMIDDALAGKG